MSDYYDRLNDWLLEQALSDDDIPGILQRLAKRLQDGGLPISRINLGRSVLNPVIAMVNMQWRSDARNIEIFSVPRRGFSEEEVLSSPFGDISIGKVERVLADLKDPDEVARYPIFKDLAAEGVVGYAAFGRRFGMEMGPIGDFSTDFRGAAISFATRRFSGFSVDDIAGLERLVPAIFVCARVDADRILAKEILEAYLGRISGARVLGGQVERGDREQIDCAILYSDLCGSVALSQQLETTAYLDTVNAYFECAINAISEHGGEVLKLIGDGVLAIFPFDDDKRPRQNMCQAALSSAREAFARAEYANRDRTGAGLPDISFGVALHVGQVIYGNVGTPNRLDFTATGPAVGMAARVEGLTRSLGAQILATKSFAECCGADFAPMAEHKVKGFEDPVELVRYDV